MILANHIVRHVDHGGRSGCDVWSGRRVLRPLLDGFLHAYTVKNLNVASFKTFAIVIDRSPCTARLEATGVDARSCPLVPSGWTFARRR